MRLHKWTNSQIINFLGVVKNTNSQEIDGHSTPFWTMCLNKELDYRKKRDNDIINKVFPHCVELFNNAMYNIKYKK